jgi:hypothetical protein
MDELMQDPAIGPEAHFVLVDPDLDELPAELARARCTSCAATPRATRPCSAPASTAPAMRWCCCARPAARRPMR